MIAASSLLHTTHVHHQQIVVALQRNLRSSCVRGTP
jgi:hypothetical protein